MLEYLEAALLGHFLVCLSISVFFTITAALFVVVNKQGIAVCLLTLACVSPFILLQWLLRRASYLCSDGSLAGRAGLGYTVILLSMTIILVQNDLLSPVTTLGIMGVSSLISAGWMIVRLRLAFVLRRWTEYRQAVREHWNYGRWLIGTGVMAWAIGNIYYFLLPIWGGMEAAAAFRALQNFYLPVTHLAVGLISIILPFLVRHRGSMQFASVVFRMVAGVCICTGLYWFILEQGGEHLLEWLYQGKYTEYAGLMGVIGLTAMCYGVTFIFRLVLLAIEKPNLVFKANGLSMIFILFVGIGVVMIWDVWGAAYVMLAALAITGFCMGNYAYRAIRNGNEDVLNMSKPPRCGENIMP
ncbi:MAG: hypothetical protein NPIRA02_23450 [Nitrospirales bacterium]|nr:MAG: hypothetical protein NPIRA02_23450 [Nitrospirales bacterium]